jgi:hypothetical protein
MPSPPASPEWMTVMALWPHWPGQGRHPIDVVVEQLTLTEVLRQHGRQNHAASATVCSSSKVTPMASTLSDDRIEKMPFCWCRGRSRKRHFPLPERTFGDEGGRITELMVTVRGYE